MAAILTLFKVDKRLSLFVHICLIKDSERDRSFREEKRSANGKVTGSYGYRDPDGIVRITTYEADERGFRSTSRESSVDVHDDHASPFGNTDGIHVIGPIPKPFSALFVV